MTPKTLARGATPVWLPYVVPFVLFLVLTTIEAQFVSVYPWMYTAKILLVGAALLCWRPSLAADQPQTRGLGLAALAGIVLTVAWFAIDRWTPHFSLLGGRVAFDPFRSIASPVGRDLFLAVRFVGLVVIVPLIEEPFYRGFLLRYVTDPDDWRRVPLGTFSLSSLAVNGVLFALSHPEWLAALVFGLAMCGLVARTKNLYACVTAHAVTNLLLGLYVIHFHQWQYW